MTTKNSTLPGFTAEAAVFKTPNQYRLVTGSTSFGDSVVTPQMMPLCDEFWAYMLRECVGGMSPSCFRWVVYYSNVCGFPQ
jgi:hypothetical protein